MKNPLIICLLLITTSLRAQDCTKYDLALKACGAYTHALEDEIRLKNDSITLLNKQNKELMERVDTETGRLPGWAWLAIGAGLGATFYGIAK